MPQAHTDQLTGRSGGKRLVLGIAGAAALVLLALVVGLLAAGGSSILATPMQHKAEPTKAPRLDGVQVTEDVAYAKEPGHAGRMNLYVPDTPGPHPVLLWTFGSGWKSDQGNHNGQSIAGHLTSRGYALVTFSVRSSAQAQFPSQVEDAKAAFEWVEAHAGEYRLDASRIALGGSSSGAWDALMGGLSDISEPHTGEAKAIVDFFGPTDFATMDAQMLPGACDELNRRLKLTDCKDDPHSVESLMLGKPVQEDKALTRRANPGSYAGKDDPPTLVVHGRADMIVPHQQSEELVAGLKAAGAPYVFYEVPGVGHSMKIATSFRNADTTVTSQGLPEAAMAQEFSWDAVTQFLDAVMPAK